MCTRSPPDPIGVCSQPILLWLRLVIINSASETLWPLPTLSTTMHSPSSPCPNRPQLPWVCSVDLESHFVASEGEMRTMTPLPPNLYMRLAIPLLCLAGLLTGCHTQQHQAALPPQATTLLRSP